jgi:hypothetical protein
MAQEELGDLGGVEVVRWVDKAKIKQPRNKMANLLRLRNMSVPLTNRPPAEVRKHNSPS